MGVAKPKAGVLERVTTRAGAARSLGYNYYLSLIRDGDVVGWSSRIMMSDRAPRDVCRRA